MVLSWVSLLQDTATEMLFPVLPLFITGVLGAPAGIVSLVEGIAQGVNSLMKGVSGRLADRYPRKPMVGAGYGVAAAAKLLLAFAYAWPIVLISRALDRFGKGLRTSPRDVLIDADVDDGNRGRAFGFHRGMDTTGAVIGPLIGLLLYDALHHAIRPLFVIAFIPAALSAAFTLLVREPARTAIAPSNGVARAPMTRSYRAALVLLTIFNLVNFSSGMIILRIRQLGFSFEHVFLAYAMFNVAYAALSYPAGRLADRLPRQWVFAIGLLAFAISFFGFAMTSNVAAAWLLFALYGVYMAFTDGVGTAWITGLVQREYVGAALGRYYEYSGFASIGAGMWAGAFWGSDGHIPFLCAAIVGASIALALAAWRPRPLSAPA